MKKKGYICVETAVVMGMYLSLLGSFIILGIHLYEAAEKEVLLAEEMMTIEELCTNSRRIQWLKKSI